jgi:beta-mannosidase
MKEFSLDGEWELFMRPLDAVGIGVADEISRAPVADLSATVPGEVHLDLMAAGRMAEPLFSDHAPACRWPEQHSWWFRKTFTAGDNVLADDVQELSFAGIDLAGSIYLNGVHLGETRNSFIPHAFSVKGTLARENILVARVTSGLELAKAEGIEGFPRAYRRDDPRRIWIRKPQYYHGWDWCEALPNIGLWRSVAIRHGSVGRIVEFRHSVTLARNEAKLAMDIQVENLSALASRDFTVSVTLEAPSGKTVVLTRELHAVSGLNLVRLSAELKSPELWWPRGQGKQNLHRATLRLGSAGSWIDGKEVRIGLRTVEIDQSPLGPGRRSFAFKINGRRIMALGGNYVPADVIAARVTPAKTRHLVQELADCGGNMLRVWGGGIFQAHDFFDACDELGILVWQDFLFACGPVPDGDPGFIDAIKTESEWAVREFRHHPALVLWCGGNENQWCQGESLWAEFSRIHGDTIYHRVLPEIVFRLSPDTPYWPGSPMGGPSPNAEAAGDVHWWNEGYASQDKEVAVSTGQYDQCRAAFISEYGVVAPPVRASVRQYLPASAMAVGSGPWQFHTNDSFGRLVEPGIRMHYADPNTLSLDQWLFYGQLQQGLLLGYSVDSFRFRWPECSGALIWMWNDAWGEVGWPPIDYYLRRKAAYYFLRRAFRPLRVIARPNRDGTMHLRAFNNGASGRAIEVEYGWMALDARKFSGRTKGMKISPGASRPVATVSVPDAAEEQRRGIFAAVLRVEGVVEDVFAFAFHPWRTMQAPDPEFSVRDDGDTLAFRASTFCHAVHCDDQGDGLFMDNNFDLLPGVEWQVRRERKGGSGPGEGWQAVRPETRMASPVLHDQP